MSSPSTFAVIKDRLPKLNRDLQEFAAVEPFLGNTSTENSRSVILKRQIPTDNDENDSIMPWETDPVRKKVKAVVRGGSSSVTYPSSSVPTLQGSAAAGSSNSDFGISASSSGAVAYVSCNCGINQNQTNEQNIPFHDGSENVPTGIVQNVREIERSFTTEQVQKLQCRHELARQEAAKILQQPCVFENPIVHARQEILYEVLEDEVESLILLDKEQIFHERMEIIRDKHLHGPWDVGIEFQKLRVIVKENDEVYQKRKEVFQMQNEIVCLKVEILQTRENILMLHEQVINLAEKIKDVEKSKFFWEKIDIFQKKTEIIKLNKKTSRLKEEISRLEEKISRAKEEIVRMQRENVSNSDDDEEQETVSDEEQETAFTDEEPEVTDTDEEESVLEDEYSGASQATIERNTLTYKYKKVRRTCEGEDCIQNCPICLCEFEEDEKVRNLQCLHFFHMECIDQWLTRKKLCPICRLDIVQS